MKRLIYPFFILALLCLIACGETGQNEGSSAQDSRAADRQGPAGTLRLCPGNPKYLEYRGKPLILITSAEHYGAVVNRDFDGIAYLDDLADEGFNYTRIFAGTYIEPVANIFGIQKNTLAPLPGRYLSPWVEEQGKYDLDRFNPDYFQGLRSFVSHAEICGIIVEVTLFSSIYDEGAWNISPLNIRNNVNGVGDVPFRRVHTLYNGNLRACQEKFIRKVVRELNGYDNIFYEIQNEPWSDNPNLAGFVNPEDDTLFSRSWQKRVEVANDVSMEWQAWVAGVISDEETGPGKKHIIAQNISNFQHAIKEPVAGISIFNFHYADPDAVLLNRELQGVIGLDETGFMPHDDNLYLTQAWRFVLSGGGLYNNLDYSFTAGHERGDWPIPTSNPGWGGRSYRKKLSYLVRAMEEVPFHKMRFSDTLLAVASPELGQFGLQGDDGTSVIYLEHCLGTELHPRVPDGRYRVTWLNIHSGVRIGSEDSLTGQTTLVAPFPVDQATLIIMPVE
jgi:hypothetical protein